MHFCQPPHSTRISAFAGHASRLRLLAIITLAVGCVLLAGCSRKFSVSVNEQVLYDPRPGHVVTVADAGLQSCINVALRDGELAGANDVQILACPALEIETLGGIGQLENLRYLDLAGNQLEHLDELRRLRRLSSVNAPNNALNDISGLLAVSSLTSAVLTGNHNIPCQQLDTLAQRLGQNLIRPAQCAD
ncbi:hypothetical protein [Pseudohongiella sp.]|uniref:Leucine-rich repeat domain-containing protein n=1 Tax=marine sediment metagenome TaxID=412755 RepID=A0A0F9W328_9ZZZZ|nr:hypothetical protein [Pseudohongiella sp.]HDZ09104.1 hypothetical protein [Pseudohongiella sp.]HEA63560.1 hypothetical protein [Pseudohongiella sp.]